MTVVVKIVNEYDRSERKKFVKFPLTLYKNSPYYVPSLVLDELETLNPEKNPAFEMCEMRLFLAYRDNKIVGRLAAIINNEANRVWKATNGRVGFFDFIDDEEVVDALLEQATKWFKEKGLNAIIGPMGFCGLDHEGLLIEGFDQVSTIATSYSYPYYETHYDRLGFKKEVDANEYLITIPTEVPERHARIAKIVTDRFGLKVLKFKNRKQITPYVHRVFDLLNRAYKDLYGFIPLSDKQIEHYADMYIPLLRWDFVTIIIKEETDEVVGFGIGMPNLSQGLIKSRGKLFPTGWYHLLKDLKGKGNKIVDLLIVGIAPEYQGKGLNAIIFNDFIPSVKNQGFMYAETNPELEENNKVSSLWEGIDHVQHKKRRFYKKMID